MQRTLAAAEAAKNPPSCLNGFKRNLLPPTEGLAHGVDFALACYSCGSDVFRIFGYPLTVPAPSPYVGLEPGDVLFRPPHSLNCMSCGTKVPLFDPETQGYDAVLNAYCSYDTGSGDDSAYDGAFRITVSIFYNIELSELREHASKAQVSPADLFDWINIFCSQIGAGGALVLEYECA